MDTLWAKLTWHTNRDGVAVATTNSMFTVVANGLNYREDSESGEWKESRDLIAKSSPTAPRRRCTARQSYYSSPI